MSYTGEVHVGGPADVRELPGLVLSKLAVGQMDNNAYLLRCRATGQQVLIDAAADPDALLNMIGPDGLTAVITTHGHADHWQALARVVAATEAVAYAHPADSRLIGVPTAPVSDQELFRFGSCALRVVEVPGHTEGSIVLVYDDPEGHPHLFTGDTLFPGGVGATFGDQAAFRRLIDGVTQRIFEVFPDEAWVYPGHGADTTLGVERPALADWRARGW